MRTPGACGGVKWGQTSLSLRLGIKGILRTAAEQEAPGPSLSRQVEIPGEGISRVVVAAMACASRPRKATRGSVQSPDERQRRSCQCCTPPTELMLRVRSLKPKPNQTPVQTSTDFASVTPPHTHTKLFLRVCDNECVPCKSPQSQPGPRRVSPARPGELKAGARLLAGWKTFAGKGCAGAARGGWTRSAALPPCGRRLHRGRPLAPSSAGLEPGARQQRTSAGTRRASRSRGGACRRRSRGLATGSSQWRCGSGGACARRRGEKAWRALTLQSTLARGAAGDRG